MVGNFWIRRWFRTLPNYFLWLLIYVVMHQIRETPRPVLLSALFSQNLYSAGDPVIGSSWSLAIEEWFYLSLPLVMFAAMRLPMSRKAASLMAIVAYIVAFTGVRGIYAYSDSQWTVGLLDSSLRKVVVCHLDAIGYGVLFSWLRFYHRESLHKLRYVLLAVGFILLYQVSVRFIHGLQSGFSEYADRVLLFSVSSLGAACLLPAACTNSYSGRLTRPVTHLSLISYSVYLAQDAFLCFAPLSTLTRTVPSPVAILIFWGTTILIGTVNFVFFERPITRLRDHISRRETNIGEQLT